MNNFYDLGKFSSYNFDNEIWILDFSGKNNDILDNVKSLAWMNSIEDLDSETEKYNNLQKLYYYYSFTRCPGNHLFVPSYVEYLFLDGNLASYYNFEKYQNLKYLKLSFFFDGNIEGIPPSCKILFCKIINFDVSHTQLAQIYCNCANFDFLPRDSLRALSVQNCYSINGIHELCNLNTLHLGDWFNSSIENLVQLQKCTELKIGKNFNQPIDGFLPPNLQKLYITSIFFNKTCNCLPKKLMYLELQSLKFIDLSLIPISCTYLKVNHQNLNFLPNGIKIIYVKIIKNIDYIIHLPNSVEILYAKKLAIDLVGLPQSIADRIVKIY